MRSAPYPKYRDDAPDWLPRLPHHWKRSRLKFQTTFMISGGTPSTVVDHFWGGDIPWVSSKDMKLSVISRTEDYITSEGLNASAAKLVPPNSMLMVVRSGILRHTIPVALSGRDVAINQDIKAIGFRPNFEPGYCRWFIEGLQSELLSRWSMIGCTVESLDFETFANEEFPLPPLPEQRAIVAFLDRETARIDGLVERKRRLLALLEEKRLAVITHAVTKGLDPKAPLRDSGIDWLGKVPKHWEVVPAAYRYEVQLGRMLNGERSDGEYLKPYLRVFDVQWNSINVDDLPLMDFPPEAQRRYRLEAGDLLVNEGGSYVGRSAIWRSEIDECYYQKALHRLRPRDRNRDVADFFVLVMEIATKLGVFVAGGNQTTIDHLTADQFRMHRFAFPPLDEQMHIAKEVARKADKVRSLSNVCAATIERLLEYRAALITNAVTGKIDVRTHAAAEATA
jgi:type I restriction enzyme, S subunit